MDNTLQLGFNLEEKLAKAAFKVSVMTDSKGENECEVTGNFHLIFIYRILNLEELASPKKNKLLHLNPVLTNALSSVTNSTSRGILLTRLQGIDYRILYYPLSILLTYWLTSNSFDLFLNQMDATKKKLKTFFTPLTAVKRVNWSILYLSSWKRNQ